MRKKRLLYLSDSAAVFSGFGRVTRQLLTYLYKTGKYEILNVAQGFQDNNPQLQRFPWKSVGTLSSSPHVLNQLNQNGELRMASYGTHTIDQIVREFKPDIIMGVNDSWGNLFLTEREFAKHIPVICWTTIDSLPLSPDQIEKAKTAKHYWTWSQFAEKEFGRLGYPQVKTQYPPLNTDEFYPLSAEQRKELRQRHGIPEDAIVFGFVFRNQLRKLVNTLIEGYKLFCERHPELADKVYLLTHTHYKEGWDIPRLIKQYGVDPNKVLCTYVDRRTQDYKVMPYKGEEISSNMPPTPNKDLVTVGANLGVSAEQLNEVYNLMDAYIHPATSGACEIPCVEAALTRKIVVTCPYSFGEDIIEKNQAAIPLEFNFYTEIGSQFLKSQPHPGSVADAMYNIINMPAQEREKRERASRKWALENYGSDNNCKKIEAYLDQLPLLEDTVFEYATNKRKHNPNAVVENLADNASFVKQLYKNILDMEVGDQDSGFLHWMGVLANNMPREQVVQFFRQTAAQELQKTPKSADEVLKPLFQTEGDKKSVVIVMKESIGDLILLTSLLSDFRRKYPAPYYQLFLVTQPQYFDIFNANPYVDKLIPWIPELENEILMRQYVDHWYYPAVQTQKFISYLTSSYRKEDDTTVLAKLDENIYDLQSR